MAYKSSHKCLRIPVASGIVPSALRVAMNSPNRWARLSRRRVTHPVGKAAALLFAVLFMGWLEFKSESAKAYTIESLMTPRCHEQITT